MRSVRKLVVLGLAALMVCAAMAAAASAAEVQTTSGTALVVGDTVNGVSSDSKLVGSFFGVSTTVTCTQSAFVGQLTANSPTPTGNLNSLTWTTCKNQSGTPCTVQTLNTAWNNSMMFNSATQLQVVVPSNGGVQISGSGCLPLSSTCTFGAGQTILFAWANMTSAPGTATVNATVTSSTCGNGTWSGTYLGRTGSTVGSGSNVQVV